jgi:hypothetical protein
VRANPAGWTTETWFHRAGCRQHFVVERHTVTNEVRTSRLPAAQLRDREDERATGGQRRERQRGCDLLTQAVPTIARNSMSMRLGIQPGEVIDRGRRFRFTWNGEAYPAYEGDTIVSALAACGERIFSRSFKYHSPAGC